MRTPIDAFLAERNVLILDGALATELEARGADLVDTLWSAKCLIETPELIREVHLDYFRAGADVATTATYQATFEGFGARGIEPPAAANLMRSAVALAASARDEFCRGSPRRHRPLVAASIGPYGAMLADGSEYRGRYALSDQALRDFHLPRLEVLATAGADVLAFETIPCLREALVLARLLEEFPAMSGWMSFSCSDALHTSEGEDVAECVGALQPFAQIAAVGVNCTRPHYVADLLRRMAMGTDKPLIAYPNSGESYDAVAKHWQGGRSFGNQARLWYDAGARILGGCCRTSPADILAIRREFEPPVR
jgi:homocysteine S-methyltransferase